MAAFVWRSLRNFLSSISPGFLARYFLHTYLKRIGFLLHFTRPLYPPCKTVKQSFSILPRQYGILWAMQFREWRSQKIHCFCSVFQKCYVVAVDISLYCFWSCLGQSLPHIRHLTSGICPANQGRIFSLDSSAPGSSKNQKKFSPSPACLLACTFHLHACLYISKPMNLKWNS